MEDLWGSLMQAWNKRSNLNIFKCIQKDQSRGEWKMSSHAAKVAAQAKMGMIRAQI